MLKVNNKDTGTTPFGYLHCSLWTYFTPCSSVSIVNIEHVNAGLDCWTHCIKCYLLRFFSTRWNFLRGVKFSDENFLKRLSGSRFRKSRGGFYSSICCMNLICWCRNMLHCLEYSTQWKIANKTTECLIKMSF